MKKVILKGENKGGKRREHLFIKWSYDNNKQFYGRKRNGKEEKPGLCIKYVINIPFFRKNKEIWLILCRKAVDFV